MGGRTGSVALTLAVAVLVYALLAGMLHLEGRAVAGAQLP